MFELLLALYAVSCGKMEQSAVNWIETCTKELSNNNIAAFCALIIAMIMNFIGICVKQFSLTMAMFSLFAWKFNNNLETQLEKTMSTSVKEFGKMAHISSERGSDERHGLVSEFFKKMKKDRVLMLFFCTVLSVIVSFSLKTFLYVAVAVLVYRLWRVLNKDVYSDINEPYSTILQVLTLFGGILMLILTKQAAFFIYVVIFSLFGSLFIIISAHAFFNLDVNIEGSLKYFLEDHLRFDEIAKEKAFIVYVFLFFAGLTTQILFLKKIKK